ncbi:hypothetical protein, partial [Faecalispora jeddahensis]|uniref:hypothetical protein n=1 Tax=Faecalispora jeddahensis TaxID=1414721 RepID=UPI0028A6C1B1
MALVSGHFQSGLDETILLIGAVSRPVRAQKKTKKQQAGTAPTQYWRSKLKSLLSTRNTGSLAISLSCVTGTGRSPSAGAPALDGIARFAANQNG